MLVWPIIFDRVSIGTQIYAKITAEKVSNDMERLSKQIESMEQFICQTI